MTRQELIQERSALRAALGDVMNAPTLYEARKLACRALGSELYVDIELKEHRCRVCGFVVPAGEVGRCPHMTIARPA